MKIYIVFTGGCYPYADGDIIGVFLNKKAAQDMKRESKSGETFMEEHEVIE